MALLKIFDRLKSCLQGKADFCAGYLYAIFRQTRGRLPHIKPFGAMFFEK
jgi:hypothetical protein